MALTPEPLKISACSKAVLLAHNLPGPGPMAPRPGMIQARLYGQAVTAFQPPCLKNFAPTFGLHPSPKSVRAQTLPDLGLPGSFRHTNLSPVRFTAHDYTLFSFHLQICRAPGNDRAGRPSSCWIHRKGHWLERARAVRGPLEAMQEQRSACLFARLAVE